MKIKVSVLIGAALDWAVNEAEFQRMQAEGQPIKAWVLDHHKQGIKYAPYSTEWLWGGPIIEREWLDLTPWPNESNPNFRWQCEQHDSKNTIGYGPTLLIAAMRAFVASRLGEEVEIPEELA